MTHKRGRTRGPFFMSFAATGSAPMEELRTVFAMAARSFIQHDPEILSPEDLKEAIVTYQAGLAARATPSPCPAQRRKAIAAGDAAGVQIVNSMVKLSRTIVREIAENRYGREGAYPLLEDLESEAHLAVLDAAARFDAHRGPKFPTFASMTVRNKIRSLVMEDANASVKVPASWARMRRRAVMERQDMADELGRNPTSSELKERLLGVCMQWAFDHLTDNEQMLPLEKRAERAVKKLRKQGMLAALDHIDEVLLYGADPVRLDAPTLSSENEGRTNADILIPAITEDTTESAAHHELQRDIDTALGGLSERERAIVRYRFGMHDGTEWAFGEIGAVFQISAERVRQLEEEVRRKLAKNPALAGHLSVD